MSEALKVFDQAGAEVGTHSVVDALLAVGNGKQLAREAVIRHLAAQRAGTASTKSKGEVAGTGAKPWKQKGTGRARAGYKQSPVWRGGGVAFGPRPRDYGVKTNRRERRMAFRQALAARVIAGDVRILEALSVEDGRTKTLSGILKALGVERGALIIVDKLDPMMARAARNLPRLEITEARNVHTYQVLRYPEVIATRTGMAELEKRLTGESAA